jgi:hypothetical protein
MPNVMGSVLVGKRMHVFTTSCISNDSIFSHPVPTSETVLPLLLMQQKVRFRRTFAKASRGSYKLFGYTVHNLLNTFPRSPVKTVHS